MELVKRRKTETVLECKQATMGSHTSEDHAEELIPGLPTDLTLQQIATKLSWGDIQVLSSVSLGWRRVIQSRQVYNARVTCNSNKSSFVFVHKVPFTEYNEIFLYSWREKSCHKLPPILSEYSRRVKLRQELVTMDGKVYAFGEDFSLYMLDLAEHRQWKQCANMQNGSQYATSFQCGVMNGKIYSFVRSFIEFAHPERFLASSSEVNDPPKNTWSKIKHMPSRRHWFELTIVGDGLVVDRGTVFTMEGDTPTFKPADFLSAYHPAKNEWREIPLERPYIGNFWAGGRLHSITAHDIHVVYDHVHGQYWAHLHSFESFPASPRGKFAASEGGVDYEKPLIVAVVCVDNELLAHLRWSPKGIPLAEGTTINGDFSISCLFQSKGFQSQQKQLVWQEVDISFPLIGLSNNVYPIQI
ncbi:unnamed protein product [Calypogeia fissa]